jgi:hypothetical protein
VFSLEKTHGRKKKRPPQDVDDANPHLGLSGEQWGEKNSSCNKLSCNQNDWWIDGYAGNYPKKEAGQK